ncbi:MAG: methyltransferase family protein [Pyrinomonadaceae bacterium]
MAGLNKRTLQRIRVPLGFIFAVVFVVFSRPTQLTLLVGGSIAVVGLVIRAWASGHIQKAKVLATSGPYAYTRNPLYLGSFILGVGFTIAAGVWWLAILFIALYLGIYLPVMRVEEEDISDIFGHDFEEYRRSVPLFIPRLTVWKPTGTKFDRALYFRYREYRASLGALIAMALLAAKSWYIG